jgi:DNA-binding NtrC family response regulator
VRELRNFIERTVSLGWATECAAPNAAVLASAPVGLEALASTDLPLKEARAEWTRQLEALYVRALLRRTHGNVTRAAELAGVNRRWLQRLIAELGLRSALSATEDDDDEP